MAICPRISQLIYMKQQAVWALHGLCCTSNTVVSLYFVRKPTPKKSGINTSYNPIKTVFTFLCLILFIFLCYFLFRFPQGACQSNAFIPASIQDYWNLGECSEAQPFKTGEGCTAQVRGAAQILWGSYQTQLHCSWTEQEIEVSLDQSRCWLGAASLRGAAEWIKQEGRAISAWSR